MNLGSMTTLTAAFSGDKEQTRYSGKYTEALNLAQQQFALDSKALWKDQSITVVGGTANYSLNSDFMYEKKVTYKGLKIEPISRDELEKVKTGDRWDDDTGEPTHYVVDPEEASKTMRPYPYPPSGDAGGTMVLTYYPLPTDLSSSGDIPLNSSALMAQFHIGISAYAAWLLMLYDDQTPFVIAKRDALLSIYNDAVSKATDTFKNTASEPLRMSGGR